MAQLPIPITMVRWTGKHAVERLQKYVFGGSYANPRAPRGIDPEFVSHWVKENVQPGGSPLAVAQVLELMRYYEREDLVPHMSRFLTRDEADARDLTRSLHAAQCIGELGTPDQARAGAAYFAQYLVPHPEAMTVFPLVLDTADSLASAVDYLLVGRRLQAAIDAAKVPNLKGTAGIPFRKYTDYSRNNYLATQRAIEVKRRLLAADPTQRLQELMLIYLGESPVSSLSLEVFAARLIRKYAFDGGQSTVNGAFSQFIDATAPSKFVQPRKDFIIHRAAQAIIYFQGELTYPQEKLYDAIEEGPVNFLWDDWGPPR